MSGKFTSEEITDIIELIVDYCEERGIEVDVATAGLGPVRMALKVDSRQALKEEEIT